MIGINKAMRRHIVASGNRFVLGDSFLRVPIEFLPIALLKSVLIDVGVGRVESYLPLRVRLQVSENMKRLFEMPHSGHGEVTRQQ